MKLKTKPSLPKTSYLTILTLTITLLFSAIDTVSVLPAYADIEETNAFIDVTDYSHEFRKLVKNNASDEIHMEAGNLILKRNIPNNLIDRAITLKPAYFKPQSPPPRQS